ncbi:S-layer homology domain-containing protein [Paenibacillus sp. LHD-38]|uniref:S-layer homology domain-containing protein n=1 Tax=Paenibacillus sp. LHD-38 TaxID=3072143 RepID=UPI00280E22B5|nr:S-layer homology domain-containing protein [Paenibacillus sp. LHD-38]MDQ8735985.1 S-layer homology domain-containing protein [Paenibacillus sp. LHD-38]
MNFVSNKMAAIVLAAAIGVSAAAAGPVNVLASSGVQTKAPAAGFQDIKDGGKSIAAIQELVKQGVMNGYGNGLVKPNAAVSRAELAKLVVTGLGLPVNAAQPAGVTDLSADKWYFQYVATLANLGVMQADGGKLKPNAPVTAAELTDIIAKALKRDAASVKYWVKSVGVKPQSVTRGELAQLVVTSQKAKPSADAEIVQVKVLNTITLEVTFSAPITTEDAALDQALKNFSFNNGLSMLNVPQLKTGSISTYIVPTTPQKAGTNYELTYKGKAAGNFAGSGEKIEMSSTDQVSYDTFEVVSELSKGVTDYGNVISAYSVGRAATAFVLDENNQYNGKTYEIISSMRAKQVTITPEGGSPMIATYVLFTQATDGRQAPKFRLPAGEVLKPGVKYTVSSEWANIASATFVAKEIAPLEIESAKALNDSSLELTLKADPKDELFAVRSIELTGTDGSKLTATYKLTSRKGAAGIFELTNGAKLVAGMTYKVNATTRWAEGNDVTVTLAK